MHVVIAGEDRPAQQVAAALANKDRLSGWYTDQHEQPRVRTLAQNAKAKIFQTSALKDPDHQLVEGDWFLTVNSTSIIPSTVIEAFGGCALNLHNGPLPEYAGRHVTQWGIRNGETQFASTIHYLEDGIDTGDIVAESWFDIAPEDTGLSLFNRSFRVGTELMLSVIESIASGDIPDRRKQDLSKRRLYRHKDALDPRIDWRWCGREIVNFVRAGNYAPLTSPSYTAAISVDNRSTEILKAELSSASGIPGQILEIGPEGLVVGCAGGAVKLLDIRHEGKVINPTTAFVAGTCLSGRDDE